MVSRLGGGRWCKPSAGRRTSVQDPRGYVTTTAYDAAGNTRSVTDAASNVTTFAYDALNRVTATTDPAGASGTLAFDAAGNVTGRTRGYWLTPGWATAGTTTQAYDAADRSAAGPPAAPLTPGCPSPPCRGRR